MENNEFATKGNYVTPELKTYEVRIKKMTCVSPSVEDGEVDSTLKWDEE